MAKRPTRIDLLELDIDLRLTDLWREAADVQEWNLDVVAAFMRAAYGKGYCDALTEELPGSLCEDHGYRIPRSARSGPDAPRRLDPGGAQGISAAAAVARAAEKPGSLSENVEPFAGRSHCARPAVRLRDRVDDREAEPTPP